MKKYFVSFVFLVLFGGYAALQYLNSSNAAYNAPVAVTTSTQSTSNVSSQPGPSASGSTPPPSDNTNTSGDLSAASPQQTQPTPTQTTPTPAPAPQGRYMNGTYTGSVENAYYGDVQVQVTVSGGKIADVRFLQYPDTHGTSIFINQQAMPILTQEAIQAQSANVNGVSGATFTSSAFQQSLASALANA